jgi:hypothetical protein
MSKSKNWSAFVGTTITGADLKLTVSGEINTGGESQQPELTKKIPQGIVKEQLLLEARPISDTNPATWKPVLYEEKLPDNNRHKYTSIKILVYSSNEVLKEFSEKEIEQHHS